MERSFAPWLAALTCVGCASSAPPVPVTPDPTPTPAPIEPPPATPETPPIPIAPGPWILLDPHHAVLADGVQETWFDKADFGLPNRHGGPAIWLPAKVGALPEAARQLVDAPLVLLTEHADVRCSVTVKALWVASVPASDPHAPSLFFEALHGANDQGRESTPAERAAAAWSLGHRVLVAELGENDATACRGPLIAAKPDAVPVQLHAAQASPAITRKALQALRTTSFWELQQDAYQKSLVVARVRYHGYREEERKRQIADGTRPSAVDLRWIPDLSRGAPKTWDTPAKGDRRPEVQTMSNRDGTLRYVFVRTGNNLACAAPAAWAVLDRDYALVDFGLQPRSFVFLDWDGDGPIDLFEAGRHWGRAHALELPGHPILHAVEIQPTGLSCSGEQIGPLPAEPPTPP